MKEINKDFEGWPIEAMTLREILERLGFTEENGVLEISRDNEILDSYPRLLVDDGMGYGVDQSFITEISNEIIEDNKDLVGEKVFNVFHEKKI